MTDKDAELKKDELRKYAETWIIVTTVLLTISFAIILFQPDKVVHDENLVPYASALAVLVVVLFASSLAVFLLARDPRQVRYPIGKMVDLGVGLLCSSLVIGGIAMGIREQVFTGDPMLIAVQIIGFVGITVIFYPMLYYLIRKEKSKIKK